MRPLRVLAAALALGLPLVGSSQATSVVPLTLTEQAKRAEVIVRATLGNPTPVKEGDVTYLTYPLNVLETVAGDDRALPQLAGKPALYFLQGAADLPTIPSGGEVFLLLYTQKLDSPVVGYNQGIYPLTAGKVSGAGDITDPTKLRDALKTARETK